MAQKSQTEQLIGLNIYLKNTRHLFFLGMCKNTVLGMKTEARIEGPIHVNLPCVIALNIDTSDTHLLLWSPFTDKLCPSVCRL